MRVLDRANWSSLWVSDVWISGVSVYIPFGFIVLMDNAYSIAVAYSITICMTVLSLI